MANADKADYVKRRMADLLALLVAPSVAIAESKFLSLVQTRLLLVYLKTERLNDTDKRI